MGNQNDFFRPTVPTAGSPIDPAGPSGSLIDLTSEVSGTLPVGNLPAAALTGGAPAPIPLSLLGSLDALSLPLLLVGPELVQQATTLTKFHGKRRIKGSAGSTSIQLELNGAPVSGAVLTWPNTDANDTPKTAVISQAVSVLDVISFRVLSVETGAEDILAGVSE